eukprot:2064194-Rhodomonas_salina.1
MSAGKEEGAEHRKSRRTGRGEEEKKWEFVDGAETGWRFQLGPLSQGLAGRVLCGGAVKLLRIAHPPPQNLEAMARLLGWGQTLTE